MEDPTVQEAFEMYNVYNVHDLERGRWACVQVPGLIEKILDACSVLPRISSDGESDCVFAEQLYFQKEEAVHALRKQLETLGYLEPEFKEKHEKLLKLASAIGWHTESRKPHEGWLEKAGWYKEALDQIHETQKLANEAIAKANLKAWPLGKPRGPFGQTID